MDIVCHKISHISPQTRAPPDGFPMRQLYDVHTPATKPAPAHDPDGSNAPPARDPDGLNAALAMRTPEMLPLMVPNVEWWGSGRQLVFLAVLARLLDFNGDPRALVVLCPGPWKESQAKRLRDACARDDDVQFMVECVMICCKWCRRWHAHIPDIPAKVSARIAGKSIGPFTTTASVRSMLVKHLPATVDRQGRVSGALKYNMIL